MNTPLKQMKITLKETSHSDVKSSERVQTARAEFWWQVETFLAKDLIFFDDSDVNLAMPRFRAQSVKRKRACSSKPSERGKNVSTIGALGFNGIVTDYSLMGTTNGLTFEAFINQKLAPKLRQGACVIMDNCLVHLGKTVRTPIEGVGAQLIYLSPYSPDFSPFENYWSKLKNILRGIRPSTYLALKGAIKTAFSQVSYRFGASSLPAVTVPQKPRKRYMPSVAVIRCCQ